MPKHKFGAADETLALKDSGMHSDAESRIHKIETHIETIIDELPPGAGPSGGGVDWSTPPTNEDGRPIDVDCRINMFGLGNIDTKNLTAWVNFVVIYYWTDRRMVGWKDQLPQKLWGPKIELDNSIDVVTQQTEFLVCDKASGRLKRGYRYKGTVSNPMDLRNFPFDVDGIDVQMLTVSTWETFDCTAGGDLATGRSYHVRKISRPSEGEWINCCIKDLTEFRLLGISSQVFIEPVSEHGDEGTQLNFSLHVSRRASYYMWKACLPLWLMALMNCTIFIFPTEDFQDRIQASSTFFLSTFAMLYVVGEALPKTDFLTKIDWLIVTTIIAVVSTGMWSVPVYKLQDRVLAQHFNDVFFVVSTAVYCGINIAVLIPPWLEQRNVEATLSTLVHEEPERQDLDEDVSLLVGGATDGACICKCCSRSKYTGAEGVARRSFPTVEDGFSYGHVQSFSSYN